MGAGAELQGSNPQRFSDLIGNVAEVVTKNRPALDVRPRVSSAAVAHEFVDVHVDWSEVMGGSALSAPEIPVDQPQPIDRDTALAGFADVGIRLAFTSSVVPFRQRIAGTLNDIHFIAVK